MLSVVRSAAAELFDFLDSGSSHTLFSELLQSGIDSLGFGKCPSAARRMGSLGEDPIFCSYLW